MNVDLDLWQAFAVSGNPIAYLEYTRNRNDNIGKGRTNENRKITGIGS